MKTRLLTLSTLAMIARAYLLYAQIKVKKLLMLASSYGSHFIQALSLWHDSRFSCSSVVCGSATHWVGGFVVALGCSSTASRVVELQPMPMAADCSWQSFALELGIASKIKPLISWSLPARNQSFHPGSCLPGQSPEPVIDPPRAGKS